MRRREKRDIAFFRERSTVDPVLGCWMWSLVTNNKGYGITRRPAPNADGVDLAHRAAWRAAHGAIPAGTHVCHKCDRPGCVNPAHLFAGTPSDNMRDMAAKERGRTVKLSRWDIPAICALAAVLPKFRIARRYGVANGTIRDIVSGKSWTHVARPGEAP